MDRCRPCGCKGRRTCLICEKEYDIQPDPVLLQKSHGYVYCSSCGKAWSGWDINRSEICPNHSGESISVKGVYILQNFISEDEKEKLLNGINKENWDPSQSGRRKQNYGPKCNFKKNKIQKSHGYVYCSSCGKAWSGWDINRSEICPNHSGESISVKGVYILQNFISEDEKEKLLNGINKENWDPSQSGRRKQNYGPKCNFKKNKIQVGNFEGFPRYSKFVQDRFRLLPILKNFNVIEQCSLEYDPKRGASIDPHIDDCWIWGERIVTLNVLGETYLTLSKYRGDEKKYNLHKVKCYPSIMDQNGCVVDIAQAEPFHMSGIYKCNENLDVTLRIHMPEKSLIILYGSARYEWEHYILREDIKSLRICLAYREFTPPYLLGGEKESVGIEILNKSKVFW